MTKKAASRGAIAGVEAHATRGRKVLRGKQKSLQEAVAREGDTPADAAEQEGDTPADAAEQSDAQQVADAKASDAAHAPVMLGGDAFKAMLAQSSAHGGTEVRASAPAGAVAASGGVSPVLILAGLGAVGGIAAALGGGGKSSSTPVTPANVAPAFASAELAAAAFNEDSTLVGSVKATDANNDAITYAVGTKPANGTVVVNADGTYTYTPNANYNGTDSFTVTASDGKGGTATQTVKLTINPVNDLPVVSASADKTVSLAEAAPAATAPSSAFVKVAGSDIDGGTVTFTVPSSTAVANITLAADGSGFTYTPKDINYHGTETITVRLNDAQGAGKYTDYQVQVTVTPNTAENQGIDNGMTKASYDAAGSGYTAGDNFAFIDNSAQSTNVEIVNFQKGDTIQVSASASKYSFAVVGTSDLEITYLDSASGASNVILLKGVAANAGFIQDEVTAELQLGLGNFFQSLADGASNAAGSTVTGTSLDADSDSNVNTFALFDAAGGNIAFTEDASVANRALIQGFGTGDTITVTNANTGAYSFARDANSGSDVVITYNNGGTINEIVLKGAASGTTSLISTLADVEALFGTGFFKATGGSSGGTGGNFTPTAQQSIDNASGTATFNAATGSIKFVDDSTVRSDVILQNFTSDDRVYTNTATSNYSFAISDTDPDDLVITFNNAGVPNQIVLDEILAGKDVFIDGYASAKAAVGFEFMVFG